MLTKTDFLREIATDANQYPDIAARYHAGDPIILQHLEAIATMLGMLAQSIDVAQGETFLKSRDATVYADAAMRGIVPQARPARVQVRVTNNGSAAVSLDTGRPLRDSRGRPWMVAAGSDIAAGATTIIEAEQRTEDVITHSVARDEPFYAIEIPSVRSDGQRLASVEVRDAQGTEWTYANYYSNIGTDEAVYHLESDERQRLYVRFGLSDRIGIQPREGDTFTLSLGYSFGDVTPVLGASFSLASIVTPHDAFLTLSMAALTQAGQDPISVDALRTLARYPSTYNENAVYLGEFDFLIRRHFSTLRFLSVWNERIEEKQRGMSVFNVNTLFVACLGAEGNEITQLRTDQQTQGEEVVRENWTPLQQQIEATILRADDSYRVRFFTPLREPRAWRIEALVGSAYVPSVVAQRIRALILDLYGESSLRQSGALAVQEIYANLRAGVPEIAEPGADVTIYLPEPDESDPPPETWRYVTDDLLTINVQAVTVSPPSWGR